MQQNTEERQSFPQALRVRKSKLAKGQRVIDRIIRAQGRKEDRPERKYKSRNPEINALEHYSESEGNAETEWEVPARALPRVRPYPVQRVEVRQEMSREAVLAERARQFISRLSKQRDYQKGHAFMQRKREQQRRKKQQQQAKRLQAQREYTLRHSRKAQLLTNIIHHQQRIGHRLRVSLQKSRLMLRAKTQNSPRTESMSNMSVVSEKHATEGLSSLQGRLSSLWRMVEGLRREEEQL